MLLVVVASVPFIMLAMLLITRKMTYAQFYIKENSTAKNEIFDVCLHVNNKSIFPIGKAEASVEYYNVFNNQINEIELHFPIQARNAHNITFQLSSKFSGIIKLKCTCIKIYDPLRIFKLKICKNVSDSIIVMPEGHEISALLSSLSCFNDESSVYSELKPGDDSSEIFDLREYIPGDKLNRIHWKLSSKKNDLVIREYSFPVDSPIVIFLNLHCAEDSEYTLPLYDTLLETLLSVSEFLLENERSHTIVYYNAAERSFVRRLIGDEDALYSALNELISSISDDLSSEKPEVYFNNVQYEECSSITFISAEYSDDVMSFIDNDIESNIKNALIVIKCERDSEEIFKPYSHLNTVPVMIGKITQSIRDIEF